MFQLQIFRNPKYFTHMFYQRRFVVKKKWARHNKEKEYKQLALEHFDHYHQQTFNEQWPSVRLALLSQPKYSALVNNFSDKCEENCLDLIGEGSYDIIQLGIERHKQLSNTESDKLPVQSNLLDMNLTDIEKNDSKNDLLEQEDDRTDLYRFVPAEKVYTDDELFAIEERQANILEPGSFDVKVVPDTNFRLPNLLKVFTQPMGEVAYFSSPKADASGKLGYYPLDGASILPVLALNLQPDDSVFDLCAAPGGKSLAILQTHLPGLVICNDLSGSRMRRLRSVMNSYVPDSIRDESELILFSKDARTVDFGIQCDKVLVDVPCLTDRHCLNENDNNIFKPGRVSERMKLTTTQRDLLIAGVKACKPGGSIVYSTCTSTMPQNDGVIQAALEHIWETTKIDVVVQDTSVIRALFKDTYKFYDKCRYGQLVLPHIQANFGPMYFCKLKRLN